MKYSSLDNLAETLSFCILKKGKIENFGHVLQHVSRWALKGICLVNGLMGPINKTNAFKCPSRYML